MLRQVMIAVWEFDSLNSHKSEGVGAVPTSPTNKIEFYKEKKDMITKRLDIKRKRKT